MVPTEPTASRPYTPAEYGIPTDTTGLLPWSHVTERMEQAMHYWICTVSSDGRPHATPVDGLWIDDHLYFGGSPHTRWSRNLAANPALCVHLDGRTDVVTLQGDAHELREPDHALAVRLSEATAQKYGYTPKPEEIGTGGMYVFHPRVVFAWTQFPTDVTRWQVPDDDYRS